MLRRLLLIATLVLLAGAAAWALWPRPLSVETATIARRAIAVTVEDEGTSRIKDVFTVSAPIGGRLMRLDLHPGDNVLANETVVASLRPAAPALLDARARAIAQSTIAAAQSAVDLAKAQLQQGEAQLAFAQDQLARSESLAERGIIPEQALQKANLDLSVAKTGVESARAGLVVRQRELDSAEAALIEGETGAAQAGGDCCIDVRAPASGKVLRVLVESEQVVAPGTPLVELGDPGDLDIVVDLLSRDAVQVEPGAPATIEGWGGPPLRARVARIDPAAVTRVSALGIEEQRVRVVLDLLDPPADRARLGHGFRIVARIVLWQGEDLVAVPMGALFRQGSDWAAFTVSDGKAHLRKLQLGHQNTDYAEILSGLEPGEEVILHPSDQVAEGVAVAVEP